MSVVDDVKARLDIVDVVSQYAPLKRAGRTYKALCPFHSEKTPSFVVFPESQTWRCFGSCNEGGDIFSFVMRTEGWDFAEALRVLAQKAGVQLEEQTPEYKARQSADDRLYVLLDEAAQLYMNVLIDSPEAASTRDYVVDRGLTEATVHHFQLGYAPDEWSFALDHFRRRGYHQDEIIAAGLAIENERGRVYDRFRHRLMFPIRDGRGRTLGFGARALEPDQQPKYLNSSQGPLFDKSQLLYGFDMARRAIRETETAVVVEGYMDVIQAHQAGFSNVVAQMGTALTETQVHQLAKYANRLILALDTDEAGVNATMRDLDVVRDSLIEDGRPNTVIFDAQSMMRRAGKMELDIRVLQLPNGKDPDEFIRATPNQWPEVIQNARSLVDYVIDVGTQSLSPEADIYERERIAKRLLPLLSASESDLQRHQNIQRLALRLRIPERDLLQWTVNKSSNQQVHRPPRARPTNHMPVNEYGQSRVAGKVIPFRGAAQHSTVAMERQCLSSLLQHPQWLFNANRALREVGNGDSSLEMQLGPLTAYDFSREDYRALFALIEASNYVDEWEPLEYIDQAAPPELAALIHDIRPSQLENTQLQASQWLKKEFKSIMQETGYDVQYRDLDDFLESVLQLRFNRLRREHHERHFVLNTDVETDDQSSESNEVRAYSHVHHLLQQAIANIPKRRKRLW